MERSRLRANACVTGLDFGETIGMTEEAPTHDPAEIEREIMEIVAKEGMVDPALLTPDATLESLGLQSIDLVVILSAVEDRYGIHIEFDKLLGEELTLPSLVAEIATLVRAAKAGG